MGYIGPYGVSALHRYKYSSLDRSYVAKYILQPLWTRFVQIFPLWMLVDIQHFATSVIQEITTALGYIASGKKLDSRGMCSSQMLVIWVDDDVL